MHKHMTMTTGRASLCALGEYLRRHCFFAPMREQVKIPQKTVRYRPVDKLLDVLDQRGHDVPVATQTRLSFDVILPLWGRRGPR